MGILSTPSQTVFSERGWCRAERIASAQAKSSHPGENFKQRRWLYTDSIAIFYDNGEREQFPLAELLSGPRQAQFDLDQMFDTSRGINTMATTEIIIAILTANKRIGDTKEKFFKAIESKDWSRASQLDEFICGMQQTLAIFEQALQVIELKLAVYLGDEGREFASMVERVMASKTELTRN